MMVPSSQADAVFNAFRVHAWSESLFTDAAQFAARRQMLLVSIVGGERGPEQGAERRSAQLQYTKYHGIRVPYG